MSVAETTNIRYVTDRSGKRQEVIVPYQTWTTLTDELEALREKQAILLGLQKACREIKITDRNPKKGKAQTLDEFLDELQG